MNDGGDEFEVRIKGYPDGTYFDEYIKLDNREQQGGTARDRYNVGEDGVRYTIEVTLKEGFTFGNFDQVQVQLNVQGQEEEVCVKNIFRPPDNSSDCLEEDITIELQYAGGTVHGHKLLGARFAF